MIDFEIIRIFLDENYSFDDKYTALGSFYFIHKTQHAFIWNFDGKFLFFLIDRANISIFLVEFFKKILSFFILAI